MREALLELVAAETELLGDTADEVLLERPSAVLACVVARDFHGLVRLADSLVEQSEEARLTGAPGAEERDVDGRRRIQGQIADNARDGFVVEAVLLRLRECSIKMRSAPVVMVDSDVLVSFDRPRTCAAPL